MTPAPVIIAIDGRSGAGKTTLAIELAAQLRNHHKVSLFHLEDIYPGWNGLAAGIERYVSTVLTPLSGGEPATWTSWDWANHYDGDIRVTLPAEIVIIEGVGAAAAEARPLLSAVVWADSPDNVRRKRALERDGGTYEPFWDQWAAQENDWLAEDDVPGHADIRVLNHADGSAPADVLQALSYLPALGPVMVPELAAAAASGSGRSAWTAGRTPRPCSHPCTAAPCMPPGWTPPTRRQYRRLVPGRSSRPPPNAAASASSRTTPERTASRSRTAPAKVWSLPDRQQSACRARSSAGWTRSGGAGLSAPPTTIPATSPSAGWAAWAMSSSAKPAART